MKELFLLFIFIIFCSCSITIFSFFYFSVSKKKPIYCLILFIFLLKTICVFNILTAPFFSGKDSNLLFIITDYLKIIDIAVLVILIQIFMFQFKSIFKYVCDVESKIKFILFAMLFFSSVNFIATKEDDVFSKYFFVFSNFFFINIFGIILSFKIMQENIDNLKFDNILRFSITIDDSYNLSFREKCIIYYIAKGFSNKRISLLTGITEGTVKNHLSNILMKTNTKNRIELINKLIS